ncbi:MAG: hypothetical protein Q4Q23_08095 [Methanobacteriaceae archaeon]|nr:hypothetical protein [Methanobacteriaceae archaeon]
MDQKEIQKKIKKGIEKINIQEVFQQGWKVDKAKIKFIVRDKSFLDDVSYYLSIDTRVIQHFTSGALKNSHDNFTLECKKGNVYIGLEDNSNMNTDEARKTITIEYNPQKVDLFTELNYLEPLRHLDLHRRYILYLDLAYDMYINISDLRYKKRRKNEYRALIEHSHLETIYLKRFGTTNAVRIYDKTAEMNADKSAELEEDTGEIKTTKYYGDCTRYEIRVKPENRAEQLMFNITNPFLIENMIKLHELWLNDGTEEKILKKLEQDYKGNEFLRLLAVHQNYDDIAFGDNRTKKKYREMYSEIKKSFSSDQQENEIFNNFNTDCIFSTTKRYLDSITFNTDLQSKLLTHKIMDIQKKYK